ncbi:hypothetical protein LEP1GSC053_3886 [Leptospira interrogans serovar Muenchen str. Brem 129]|nr:hypothetical protein LEP1GSC053_3886 [Leptospira interrogans serovar Muenchen str. Brem 129]
MFGGFSSKTFYINFYNRMFKILLLNVDLNIHSVFIMYMNKIKKSVVLYNG